MSGNGVVFRGSWT